MERHTLTSASKIAEELGGKCLSVESVNGRMSGTFECPNGHINKSAIIELYRHGFRCIECSKIEQYNKFKELIENNGGTVLSGKYINMDSRFEIVCLNGHVRTATYRNVVLQYHLHCIYCDGKFKHNIGMLRDYAKSKNGKCLSEIYIDAYSYYEWECEKGHRWSGRWNNINIQNQWCPECYNLRRGNTTRSNIERMQEAAKSHGGKCLSTEYRNVDSPLKWQCKEGHEWTAIADPILNRGVWCPYCSGLLGDDIETLRNYAKIKGGVLLSEQYKRALDFYEWQCAMGHKWKSMWSIMKFENSWCPNCVDIHNSKGEIKSREILERLVGRKLPRTRPRWLRSSITGCGLELDGFDGENLAFEYNGGFHYFVTNMTGEYYLERIQIHDKIKVDECKKRNIVLIVIPYWVQELDLESFIINELGKNKIVVKKDVI